MKKKLALLITLLAVNLAAAKEYKVSSPDGKLVITVWAGSDLHWSVHYGGETLLQQAPLGLSIEGKDATPGFGGKVKRARVSAVDERSTAVVPSKFREIYDLCNQLTITFADNSAVVFRAYDNGAAYRFETAYPDDTIYIAGELSGFDLGGDFHTYWPQETDPDFITHCEAFFTYKPVSAIEPANYAYLPVYLSTPGGVKMVITESDLSDYPNMFLFAAEGVLEARFPQVILESRLKEGADRDEEIIARADYIARTSGTRTFPWRIVTVDPDDRRLLENNLAYQLASPAVSGETDWIRPGKISWEWWNSLNVYGVDFEAGVNTDTYKYFIDFAAANCLEYILLDEGWSKSTHNIREPQPGLDLAELIRYGNEKGVGLVLWALWNPLAEDIEGILDVYRDWGIKGVKIDFMQRNDQDMVNFYEDVAKAAFERRLLVDFHGSFKPSGLQRKYPNVMTYEGVYGNEHQKCSYDISPDHNLILPFTRMVAGPMDYTPGSTQNATKGEFTISWEQPRSQGTRAHQTALFVVFESPLQMLCDSPSHYYREPEFTSFISSVPTVWDQTVALHASAGEYLAIARRNGDNWYIGALTNWDGRELELDLSFLGEGTYDAVVMADGVNANRYAQDFTYTRHRYGGGDKINIKMANGGGWAAILTPAAE
ncbi:MAG: glycoside hydrolase family 97 protein [Alistipes sp.]|nr:glycoside hydrolase family 97 protein [Alistipes sp.]